MLTASVQALCHGTDPQSYRATVSGDFLRTAVPDSGNVSIRACG